MHRAPHPRSTFYVPHILRLQAEIGGMFADNMDLLTLTRWRLTCKTNYEQTAVSLHRSLMSMLSLFIPSPIVVLDIITQHHAVFGGLFALAYVLRDRSILLNSLDIYTSDYEFAPLCSSLLENPGIRNGLISHEYSDNTVLDALRTLVSRVLTIQTSRGTTIRIHRSYTSSSTAPISRASCTALSNFVTVYGFGCSHPLLTLNRRTLITDQELPVIPIPDHEVHDALITHNFSLGFSPMVWLEFRRPAPPCSGRKISRGPMPLNLEDGEIPNEGTGADFDDAVHTDGESPEMSVGEESLVSSTGSGSIQPAGVDPIYTVGGSSGWLTCFPVEGLTTDATRAATNVDRLGPSENVLSFHATLSDNAYANRQDGFPGVGVSLDSDGLPCTEIQDPRTLYAPGHGSVDGHIMPQPLHSDADTMLDSIYSLGIESLINDDAYAPPSPMSRLLAVLDPVDRPSFQLPIGMDPSTLLADNVSQTPVSTSNRQTVPSLARDLPLVNAPTVFDLSCTNPVDTIDHGELDGYAEYHFTEPVDYTTLQSTGGTVSMGTSPASRLRLTHDLQRYDINEPVMYDEPQPENSYIYDSACSAMSSSAIPAVDIVPPIHDNPTPVDSIDPPCPTWPFNQADVPYGDINCVAQTDPCYVQPNLGDPFLSHIHPVNATTQFTVGHDDGGHYAFDHPYHSPTNIMPVSDPANHLMSPRATYTDIVSNPVSWQPSTDGTSPYPNLHNHIPVTTDLDLLTSSTTIPSSMPATPLWGFSDHHNDVHQDYVPNIDHLVDIDTLTVQVGIAPAVESGTLPAFENTPVMGIHTDPQVDSPEASVYEGDESDDHSNSADTDVYPPRPFECWRHRYVCPSQGRYFGDRGSFVEFFDPLRGGEQYCAQNNIAPFGLMVVWRVLSTFNCEEGCDMYDDVLEDGVTSLPVLIRCDPFGELRDTVSDLPMVGFHKHRSLSP